MPDWPLTTGEKYLNQHIAKKFNRTFDGRLHKSSDWSPDIAMTIAQDEGILLTKAHWDVICLARDYYFTYNVSPILKLLKREVARNFSAEKASDEAIYSLFPNGIQFQLSRIAGIPIPMLDSEFGQHSQVKQIETKPASQHYRDSFKFKGKQIKVYPIGNIVNMENWTEGLAIHLAEKEGIILNNAHWVVLNYLRKFYFQYGITPMVKILMKHMEEELGECVSDRELLYRLFPKGPSRQGSRIAGLPAPQGCIDNQ